MFNPVLSQGEAESGVELDEAVTNQVDPAKYALQPQSASRILF